MTSSPRDKIWSCQIHNKNYLNAFQYETHLKQVHQGNYKCTNCGKSYVNKYGLDQHIRTVHLGQGFMCPIPACFKQFTTHRGCDLHAAKHTEPQKFRCDDCNFVCGDKDSLRTHTIEHSMKKRYQCSYFTKHFRRSHDCKQHGLKCPAKMESGSKEVSPMSNPSNRQSGKQKNFCGNFLVCGFSTNLYVGTFLPAVLHQFICGNLLLVYVGNYVKACSIYNVCCYTVISCIVG